MRVRVRVRVTLTLNPNPNPKQVAGLPELLRAYGAERAWARVCAALRGALHEAPPLEGLEPLALPLPGGEAEARCTPRPRHRGPRYAPALAALHHATYPATVY